MSIRLNISQLLATFPAIRFVDSIDIPLEYRPRRIGGYVEKFVTDDKFTTVTKNYPQQQLIRSISWDKYKCSLLFNESQIIDNIDIAGNVTVQFENGTLHQANVIEFGEPVNVGGTDYRQVDFTYYDTNLDNYLAVPINDFLAHSILDQLYLSFKLNTLIIGGDTFYTALNHKIKAPGIEQVSEQINGIEKVIKSNYQKSILIRLYVNENQAATIAANCPQLGQSVASSIVYTDTINNMKYQAIERIIPEIVEVDFDLFQVDIELKHSNLTVNHY